MANGKVTAAPLNRFAVVTVITPVGRNSKPNIQRLGDEANGRLGISRFGGSIPFFIGVAVGTTIADRPPHRSVRARLHIKCVPSHFMRYVAAKFMWRPAFTTVRIREPVHLDTT
jgi:hypothetical protein